MLTTEQERRFQLYFRVMAELPGYMRTPGNFERGEIQLVLNMDEMAKIEKIWRVEFENSGRNPDHANIGILYEDHVKWHLNHAVRVPRPDGTALLRGWDTVVWKNGIGSGKSVIVVPLTPDGRVVMVPAYRHTAGRWELELPGGGSMIASSHRECVKFELLEEAGYTAGEIIPLEAEEGDGTPVAYFCPDPSTQVTPVRAFAVRVVGKTEAKPEIGEVFGKAMLFSRAQLATLFTRGYADHPTLPGVRCYPQDGRNGYGLLMAIFLGLIR